VAISRIRKWVEDILKEFNYYLLSIGEISNYFIEENYTLKYVIKEELSFDYIMLDDETIVDRIKYINYVINAFNKLSKEERIIIYCLYICKEKFTSESICEKVNVSISKYYRDKKEAITKLAYALGIKEDSKDD
jgi:ArpU family phage transcriptional regulator